MQIKKDTPEKQAIEMGKYSCNGCTKCCEFSSGFLVKDDARILARFLGISEEDLKKKYLEEVEVFNKKLLRPKLLKEGKPYGKCVFLTDKGCSVHAARPLMCRIGNCSENGESLRLWFRLNHELNLNDPESIRQFAAYLKSGGKTLSGGSLEEMIPNPNKLRKILNYEVFR